MCHTPIYALSGELRETARENHRILLQRLADVGQKTVAEIVGVTESKMSRIKDTTEGKGDLELFASIAAVLGIKLTDRDAVYCDRDMDQAMATMLRTSVNSPDFIDIIFSGGDKK
ncbi:CII family transcriptional regulator [Psychrobacter raelei]|uniref:CII family transcriptional regulator n=1 Tax=Psychrobacter raelei TaxID=2565531 RepID=A0AAT9PBK2_9GAMM